MARSGGCARLAKGNVLDDGKPGAFGAMTAFHRICFDELLATAPGEARRGDEATMRAPGGVPEWPKGTGCKPVGLAYGGSNPPAPTRLPAAAED